MIGYEVQQCSSSFVDVDHALKWLCEQYDSVWQGLHTLPRQAPDRVCLSTYYRWFDREKWLDRPKYLFFYLSVPVTCAYLRLGTHNLQVELGLWQNRQPRHLRICQRCHMHAMDDERHLVFECPALEHACMHGLQLFNVRVGENMQAFMTQKGSMLSCGLFGLLEVHFQTGF